MKTRVAIMGYGNLGRGVELALRNSPDMEFVAVFSRRDPAKVSIKTTDVPVISVNDIDAYQDKVDVLIICGGSATDLPKQTPQYVKKFNVVDSFDTHACIPDHFAAVDAAGKETNHVGVISVGWDPGLFSLARVYSHAVLPVGKDYTFWGKGVSQGHSDAVRAGKNPELTTREKHTREVFAVLEEGADAEAVTKAIVTMPNYFSDYDTTVHFISEEEMKRDHSGLAHGGFVIRSGKTGTDDEHNHIFELALTLDSNPEFTGSVLVAYARAAHRIAREGGTGCRTALDIAPAYLCPESGEELRAHLL